MNLYRTDFIKMIIAILIFLNTGCQKDFLEAKPDKSLLVPTTLTDMQALLDNYNVMNSAPFMGVVACDDIYTTDAGWEGAIAIIKNIYLWEEDIYQGQTVGDWNIMYQQIFYANIVLDGLANYKNSGSNLTEFNAIKGRALFYRALSYYHLAQLFAKPYQSATAKYDLGLPTRVGSSIADTKSRGDLQSTYEQILKDLNEAKTLLPIESSVKTRPTKQATFALLARVYLTMQDYTEAINNASLCLAINNKLLDFNDLEVSNARPIPSAIPNGNDEVLFFSQLTPYSFLQSSALTMIDEGLYKSYNDNDLRKYIFFRDRGNGVITFKGNYSGSGTVFAGIATDEVYLIRSECYARKGNTDAALNDLNTLMMNRWDKEVLFPAFTTDDPEEALSIILEERRKELVYRNQRWTDLRRLNLDIRFAKMLKRKIKETEYTLSPNDNRYVFAIPENEINSSGIIQNER